MSLNKFTKVNESHKIEHEVFNINDCHIVINIDQPTRLESSGKKYAIFKDFYLSDGNVNLMVRSPFWIFSEYMEDKNYNITTTGDTLKFESLQKAMNYAEYRNLNFY